MNTQHKLFESIYLLIKTHQIFLPTKDVTKNSNLSVFKLNVIVAVILLSEIQININYQYKK